jgi:hypothetical protein
LVRRGTVRGVIDLNFFDTIVRLLHTGRPAHFYFTYSPLSLSLCLKYGLVILRNGEPSSFLFLIRFYSTATLLEA